MVHNNAQTLPEHLPLHPSSLVTSMDSLDSSVTPSRGRMSSISPSSSSSSHATSSTAQHAASTTHNHPPPVVQRLRQHSHAQGARNSAASLRQSWVVPVKRASASTAAPDATSVITLNHRPTMSRHDGSTASTSSTSSMAHAHPNGHHNGATSGTNSIHSTISSTYSNSTYNQSQQRRNVPRGTIRTRLRMIHSNSSAPSVHQPVNMLVENTSPSTPSTVAPEPQQSAVSASSMAPAQSASLPMPDGSISLGGSSAPILTATQPSASFPLHIVMHPTSPHPAVLDKEELANANINLGGQPSSLPADNVFSSGIDPSSLDQEATAPASPEKAARHASMPLPRPGWRLFDVHEDEVLDNGEAGGLYGEEGGHHHFVYSASNASSVTNLHHPSSRSHSRQNSSTTFFSITPANLSALDLTSPSFSSPSSSQPLTDEASLPSNSLSLSSSQPYLASAMSPANPLAPITTAAATVASNNVSGTSPPTPQLRSIKNSKSPLALRRSSTVTNSTASSPSNTLLSPSSLSSMSLNAALPARRTKVLREERERLILEILTTERSYVDGLLVLQNLFYEPLNAPYAHMVNSHHFSTVTSQQSNYSVHNTLASNPGSGESAYGATSTMTATTGIYSLTNTSVTSLLGNNGGGAFTSTTSTFNSNNSPPLLSKKSISEIFSNFPEILKVNTLLLTQLEKRICGTTFSTGWESDDNDDGDPDGEECRGAVNDSDRLQQRQVIVTVRNQGGEPEELVVLDEDWCIGDIFVEIAPFFKMYSIYVKTFASALTLINECMSRNSNFAEFVKTTNRRPECKNLDFQAYLMMPVQRIPRYRMLLESLLRHTPSHHPDHRKLQLAYEALEQTATFVNETIRRHEMFQEMLDIQRRVTGMAKDGPIIVPGRVLLKKGQVNKISRRNVHIRILFLFSDCLIWTSPSLNPIDDTLAFHRKVKLETCTVVGAEDPDPARKFAFQIISPEKSSQVYVDSQREKDDWMNAIRNATQEYLSAKRTLRISTTPMHSISAGTSNVFTAGLRRYDSILGTGSGGASGAAGTATTAAAGAGATNGAGAGIALARSQTIPVDNGGGNAVRGAVANHAGQRDKRNTIMQGVRVVENYSAPVWVPDTSASKCMLCKQDFHSIFRRKHHCRACGKVVCYACSTKSILIRSGGAQKVSRACDDCIAMLPEETNDLDIVAVQPTGDPLMAAAHLPSPQSPESMTSFSDDGNSEQQQLSAQSLDAAVIDREDDYPTDQGSTANVGTSSVVRGLVAGLQRMRSRTGPSGGLLAENGPQTFACEPASPDNTGTVNRRSGAGEFVSQVKKCALCSEEFGVFKWRNMCQRCRRVVCSDCLTKKQLDQYIDPAFYASPAGQESSSSSCSSSRPGLSTAFSDSAAPPSLDSCAPSSPPSSPKSTRSQSYNSFGGSNGGSWRSLRHGGGHVDSGVGIVEKLCDPCSLGLSIDQITVLEGGGGWQYTQAATLGKNQSQEIAAALAAQACEDEEEDEDGDEDDEGRLQQHDMEERLASLDIATGGLPLAH